jgi:hypothetical protein
MRPSCKEHGHEVLLTVVPPLETVMAMVMSAKSLQALKEGARLAVVA